jgi:predicted metal-dependent hydrolase
VANAHEDQERNRHYLAYFDCFNRGKYFEAHEVLEGLWLPQRRGPNGPFYKGLIQLAGAFVHVQKRRPGPAAALLKLASGNLTNYPGIHERLALEPVRQLIRDWLQRIQTGVEQDGERPRLDPPTVPTGDSGLAPKGQVD